MNINSVCNQVFPENVMLLKIIHGVMTKTIIQAGFLMDELVIIITMYSGWDTYCSVIYNHAFLINNPHVTYFLLFAEM